jgi:Short C-terminal domain/Phospholipase_D-nuclease N-terminal
MCDRSATRTVIKAEMSQARSADPGRCSGSRHPDEGLCSVMLADFGTGQVFFSMLYFFLFFIWIWLLIVVFSDVFRSHDLGGFAKALWVIFVIVLPYLGVFVYLIARGHKMSEHALQAAEAHDAAQRAYIQSAVGSSASTADELARLADLKSQGVISDAEFEQLKAKALS